MPVYTVSQIARYVKSTVDADRVLANLYVTGEVSNFSRASSGHCYFSLKDGTSQIQCVKFREEPSPRGGSRADQGEQFLANGAAVTAHGRMTFYGARGELQYYVHLVQPEGVGELYMEFLRVKAKLDEEGLFAPSRKRRPPAFPGRIAVVTSLTGAVLHDVRTVLARRYPLVELVLVHTPVQGDQAPWGIISALRTVGMAAGIDLVILARGGGSLEELAAFNREDVARAIHACPIPVVSAVGHETDVTIADLVADLRAPTPSAAAEMVTPDVRHVAQRIELWRQTMLGGVNEIVDRRRRSIGQSRASLGYLLPDISERRQRIDEAVRAAAAVVARDLSLRREQVRARALQLDSLHPGNTLARGYALVDRAVDGKPVLHATDVSNGDSVHVRLGDGSFQAVVTGRGNHDVPRPKRGTKQAVPAAQGSLL